MVPVVDGTPHASRNTWNAWTACCWWKAKTSNRSVSAARKANFQYLEKTHPLKDEIEIRLLRHALRQRLPILGICRGSQLLNVVCGGTLYGDVQKEKELAPSRTSTTTITTPTGIRSRSSPELRSRAGIAGKRCG